MVAGADVGRRRCPVCQATHTDLIGLLGPNAPDDWLAVSEGERLEAELTQDVCLLPHRGVTRYFVRGHIQIPVDDPDLPLFVWSVWVELDEASMAEIARTWTHPNRAAIPPLEGRLATELPYEQPTRGLQITVHTRDPGQVPLLMVTNSASHTLSVEQHDGISLHRVAEFNARLQRARATEK